MYEAIVGVLSGEIGDFVHLRHGHATTVDVSQP
jgi:hypothetical protein